MGRIIDDKPKRGFTGFLEDVSPYIPIVGKVAENILAGINERKARLYNSPAQQVKRLNEAGLPKASASNISPGGGSVVTSGFGTDQFNQNLSSSITRQIDRKRLDILKQELRVQKAQADEREAEVRNKLNPTGVFDPTNLGTTLQQTQVAQSEAIKGAQIVNKWLPIEKAQGVLKTSKDIEQIAANTRNTLAQYSGILSDNQTKSILAQYQGRMSAAELANLVSRTTGINTDNAIKAITLNIEYQTQLAKIEEAKNRAYLSGQQHDAMVMNNILLSMQTDAAKQWYAMKTNFDKRYKGDLPGFNKIHEFLGTDMIRDMIYLNMFNPQASNNANLGTLLNLK